MRTLILRFLGVGALNTALGLGLFPVLYFLFGQWADVNVILVASYVVCTFSAFTLHRNFTFRSTGGHISEGARFVLVTLALLGLNAALLNVTLHLTDWHPVVVQTVIAVSLQLFNFFLLRKLVFRKSQP
jgi:putative flippase GtrA